jgi:hypothetical protein
MKEIFTEQGDKWTHLIGRWVDAGRKICSAAVGQMGRATVTIALLP